MIIAIDFDGTCVTHEYPNIGRDIGAVPVLRKLIKAGHQLILNTMRSGAELQEAVDWFEKNDIFLHGINENPDQKAWTDSPKLYADLYIDDATPGCPLKNNYGGRPYVDWEKMQRLLAPITGERLITIMPENQNKDRHERMSKYEEYRAMAEKMETVYRADIKNTARHIDIRFNPVSDSLLLEIDGYECKHEWNIEGDEGEALFKALKQIYE